MKITNTIIALAVFLLAVSAWTGDLTTDNLTVMKDTAIYGKMNFYSGLPAVGGTITTNGNYRIHTFTNSGTFEVLGGSVTCDVLIVAGGGGGGGSRGGGGGAGGLIYTNVVVSENKTVTIGAGGAGGYAGASGANGANSVFGTITATGGGGGGGSDLSVGKNGGSGGGSTDEGSAAPGSGVTGQGNSGGYGYRGSPNYWAGGGGGGAGEAGQNGVGAADPTGHGGDGGDGLAYDISGTSTYYAGGGGGGVQDISLAGAGGLGGGGAGTNHSTATAGTANTGGGGGAGAWDGSPGTGGAGGSGIVIVRYLANSAGYSNVTNLTVSISSNGISQVNASGSNVFMGKVGIGTDNPAEKLHVLGNLRVDGTNIVAAMTLGGEARTNWPTGAQGALMASNNLSDVANVATARSNLGLGSAATNDAGVFLTPTSDGSQLTNITAAQVGAVSTNAGALIAANNLSDVANNATARANLGLGSAATNAASAFLTPTGNGSQLTGITAAQVGALSTNGGTMNGTITFVSPAGDVPMGVYTNQ